MAKKATKIDKRIDVIVLEPSKHLGEKYDIVKVKPIFARNVLFPQSKAVLADADALYAYKDKIEKAKQNKVKRSDAFTSLFKKIEDDGGLEFTMKANDKGVLYEKIHASHLVKTIKESYGEELEEHRFKMKKHLSNVGEYSVPFHYNNVESILSVSIKGDYDKKPKAAREEPANESQEEKSDDTPATENTDD